MKKTIALFSFFLTLLSVTAGPELKKFFSAHPLPNLPGQVLSITNEHISYADCKTLQSLSGGLIFQLEPGNEIALLLEARSELILRETEGEISGELEFYVSDGSGLLQKIRANRIDDKTLVLRPETLHSVLIHILQPVKQGAGTSRLKIEYLSLPSHRDEFIAHDELPMTGVHEIRVSRDDESAKWSLVRPGQASIVNSAQGGAYTVESIAVFDYHSSRPSKHYQILVSIRASENPVYRAHVLLEESTPLDSSRIVSWKNNRVPAGLLRRSTFLLPENTTQIRFESTSPVLLRLRPRDRSSFLLPVCNAPEALDFDPAEAPAVWHQPTDFLSRTDELISENILASLSLRFLRDNRLQSLYPNWFPAIDRVSQKGDAFFQLKRTASMIDAHNSYHSEVPPSAASGLTTGKPLSRLFILPDLPNPKEPGSFRNLPPGSVPLWLALTPEGSFFTPENASSMTYKLPDPDLRRTLRLVCSLEDSTREKRLKLDFDRGKPVELLLRPSLWGKGKGAAALPVEASWASVDQRDTFPWLPPLGAKASELRRAAPLVAAAATSFTAPRYATTMTVMSPDGNLPPLLLQERKTAPPSLDEDAYRFWLHSAGAEPMELFQASLYGELYEAREVTRTMWARKELANHWQPLVEEILSLSFLFRRDMDDLSTLLPDDSPPLSPEDAAKEMERCIQAAREGYPIAAIEACSRVIRSLPGTQTADRAAILRIQLLAQAGEGALAEKAAKHLHMHAFDPEHSLQAAQMLYSLYQNRGDTASIHRLAAHAFHLFSSPAATNRLAKCFLEENKPEFAHDLLRLLPAEKRDIQTEMLSALLSERESHFHERLSQIRVNDPNEAQYWAAVRLLLEGNSKEALKLLDSHPKTGQWITKLQKIRDTLKVIPADARLSRDGNHLNPDICNLLLSWFETYDDSPLPKVWQDIGEQVNASAGSELVYTTNGTRSFTRFRCDPEHPAELNLIGPARFRLTLRPLHPKNGKLPVDGFAFLSTSDGIFRNLSVLNNRASSGIRLTAGSDEQPGWSESFEFTLPAGQSLLQLHSDDFSLLFKIERLQPFTTGQILPRPTPLVIDAYLNPKPVYRPRLRLNKVPLPFDLTESKSFQVQTAKQPPLSMWVNSPSHLIPKSTFISSKIALTTDPLFAVIDRELRARKLEGYLEGSGVVEDPALYRAESLLLAFSRNSRNASVLMACAAALQNRDGADNPKLSRVLSKLLRHSSWRRVDAWEYTSGFRRVPVTDWFTLSPGMRVAAALKGMGGKASPLFPGSSLSLPLQTDRERVVRLKVLLESFPYEAPAGMDFSVRFAGRDFQFSLDSANRVFTTTEVMPVGEDLIAVDAKSPWSGQFAMIQLEEKKLDGGWTDLLYRDSTRKFYAARPGEPASFPVVGPAWVKIDRLEKGDIHTEFLLAGSHTKRIEVPTSEDELLFRAYILEADLLRSDLISRSLPPEAPAQSGKPGELPLDSFRFIEIEEDLPAKTIRVSPGASWTAGIAFLRNREDIEETGGVSDSLVTRLSIGRRRKHFDLSRWEHEAFVEHGESGPLLYGGGLRRISDTPFFPLRYRIGLSAWFQPFSDSDLQQGARNADSESRFRARADLWRTYRLRPDLQHRPQFRLEASRMSLRSDAVYKDENVSGDLFSNYKSDHLHRIVLSDELSWYPWSDVRVEGSANVSSNETPVKPDRFGLVLDSVMLVRHYSVKAGLSSNFYIQDKDRNDALSRTYFRLSGDYWKRFSPRDLFRLQASFTRTLETDENAFLLELDYVYDPSGELRDFVEGNPDFLDLRRIKALRVLPE